MRFVTLYLPTENVHLIKDVGMIPYKLHTNYGYHSSIATWQNGSYPYLENEVKGLELFFVKKSIFGRIYDGMHFLKYEAASIDILNIYHLNLASFLYERVYRRFDPMGKIYLKLDMNEKGYRDVFRYDPKGFIKRATIRGADIVSVENTAMHEGLSKRFKDRIVFIPNGCFVENTSEKPDEASDGKEGGSITPPQKYPVVLTVGNLGTVEKATDVLLKAFAASALKHDLSLKLIGPVAPSFEPEIRKFYEEYPELEKRVTFTGPITDREELRAHYQGARFFVLPSRSESFGIVLLEAASEGCYIIASEACCAAMDITKNGKYGTIVKTDDAEALSEAFCRLYNTPADSDQLRAEEIRYIRRYFSWDSITKKLHSSLQNAFESGKDKLNPLRNIR